MRAVHLDSGRLTSRPGNQGRTVSPERETRRQHDTLVRMKPANDSRAPGVVEAAHTLLLSCSDVHRELALPGWDVNLSRSRHRALLVNLQLTIETLQKSVLCLIGTGSGPAEVVSASPAGMSHVDAHLDAAGRGLALADAGMCEALDALGSPPGSNPVPSAVQARRKRLMRR